MAVLEVFVHAGCLSERLALALVQEIQQEFSGLKAEVHQAAEERAQILGIIVAPAFVLDGQILAVGVPSREWLARRLRAREPQANS
jgi:predicted DsbA family dithiol-disulfide isomerase